MAWGAWTTAATADRTGSAGKRRVPATTSSLPGSVQASYETGDATSRGEPPQAAARADAIIGGTTTYAYPAVGVTVHQGSTGCSATLIRSNVILLAGHCFEPGRSDIRPWQFEIRKSATESHRYATGED